MFRRRERVEEVLAAGIVAHEVPDPLEVAEGLEEARPRLGLDLRVRVNDDDLDLAVRHEPVKHVDRVMIHGLRRDSLLQHRRADHPHCKLRECLQLAGGR